MRAQPVRRPWRNTAVIVVIAGLLWAAILVFLLPGPEPHERAAVALLEQPRVMPGSNAYADLWRLEYAIPDDAVEAMLQADIDSLQQLLGSHADLTGDGVPFTATAEQYYPKRVGPLNESPYCGWRDQQDCLSQVRADPAAVTLALQQDAEVLRILEGLPAHGHVGNRFQRALLTPTPNLGWLRMLHTASALDFAEGRVKQAMERSCRNIGAARRLAEHSDDLVIAMVLDAQVRTGTALLAQMLAELPLDYQLPDSCLAAFEPELATADICRAIAGEYQMYQNMYQRLPHSYTAWHEKLLMKVIYRAERSWHRAAVFPAEFCQPALQQSLTAAQVLQLVKYEAREPVDFLLTRGCLSNPVGCILVEVGNGFGGNYLVRRQQTEAVVRLMHSLLVVRSAAMDAVFDAEAMQPAIEHLQAFELPWQIDGNRQGLCIDWQPERSDSRWLSLPWPGSRQTGQQATALSCMPPSQ